MSEGNDKVEKAFIVEEKKRGHLIDGRSIAKMTRDEVRERSKLLSERGVRPKLSVILIGGHPPSQIYVKYKLRAADEIGILTEVHRFDEDVKLDTLQRCISELNADSEVHGILVQLPLPSHISSNEAWTLVESVSPHKDVDGLHPLNQGLIGLSAGSPERPEQGFVACTPLGCLRLLRETLGNLSGKRAVVIGRSRIVGRPMAALLTAANATVTLCHSRTASLAEHLKGAEIVVAAAGIPRFINAEMLSAGVTVIDVGIHRLDDGSLCGDVDFESVKDIAGAISPVPGGVGPMTIASLMSNVCLAAERAAEQSSLH